jgi:hypothetical protein
MNTVLAGLGVFAMGVMAAAQTTQETASFCRPSGKAQLLANVVEASGVAASRKARGTVWTLNDSGDAVLFGFDTSGRSTRVDVAGANVQDWEDLSVGACSGGTREDCLYIADIGDNRASRKRITIYRVPEPAVGSAATGPAEVFHAVYPDHPHDAEALIVIPGGQLFVVTKEVPPRLYKLPAALKPGATATLEFVRQLDERVRITGGAVSADGRWTALRSNGTLLLYRTPALMSGGDPIRIDLTALKEPQGEGVAFGPGNELYLVSEGGEGGAGLLTRLNCTLPK